MNHRSRCSNFQLRCVLILDTSRYGTVTFGVQRSAFGPHAVRYYCFACALCQRMTCAEPYTNIIN
jgi:hypothetical protein